MGIVWFAQIHNPGLGKSKNDRCIQFRMVKNVQQLILGQAISNKLNLSGVKKQGVLRRYLQNIPTLFSNDTLK